MNNNFQSDNQTLNPESPKLTNPEPSGLMKIVSQCLPFAPLLFEQFTGQKIPPMSGTMAEIQASLSQVMAVQQQILTNQQALNNRLVNLESSASQQLTNLNQQVQSIKSIRLSHSKETKAIDYHLNQANQTN